MKTKYIGYVLPIIALITIPTIIACIFYGLCRNLHEPKLNIIELSNPNITVTETYVLIESTDILRVDMEQGKRYSVAILRKEYDKAIEEYEKSKASPNR